MEEKEEQSKPPRKPSLFDTLMAKILVLIVIALMIGMCTVKYIS